MIQPENLKFKSFEPLANSDSCIFISSTEKKEYNTQTNCYTNKVIGHAVKVALPKQAYETIIVTVPTSCNVKNLKPDDKISFIGFEARFVKNFAKNEYFLSAKANDIEVAVEF